MQQQYTLNPWSSYKSNKSIPQIISPLKWYKAQNKILDVQRHLWSSQSRVSLATHPPTLFVLSFSFILLLAAPVSRHNWIGQMAKKISWTILTRYGEREPKFKEGCMRDKQRKTVFEEETSYVDRGICNSSKSQTIRFSSQVDTRSVTTDSKLQARVIRKNLQAG